MSVSSERNEAQTERITAVLKFARERLSPGARAREAEGRFDRELWNEAAEFGLSGLPIPEAQYDRFVAAISTLESANRVDEIVGLTLASR